MEANFPTLIWDGDSGNRDSDSGNRAAPDLRDWEQVISEIASMQDYTLNHDIDLGTRSITFGPTPEATLSYSSSIITWDLAASGANALRIGDGTNYLEINSTGGTALAGTAKRKITLRPNLDYITQVAHTKPTQVTTGVFKGYSFPIYNSDNEELFYNIRTPYRWDGKSDILVCVEIALADAEDIGDTFKFQLSWEHALYDDAISTTSNDVEVQKVILTGHIAQYSIYHLHFTINYDIDGPGNEIQHECLVGFRLRRIASSGTAIDNEIIVLSAIADFQIDKLYDTWVRA